MKTKRIEYSYPTSTNATRFKFGKTGCWTVSLVQYSPRRSPVAVAGFESIKEAEAFAEQMPEPWDRYTKKSLKDSF